MGGALTVRSLPPMGQGPGACLPPGGSAVLAGDAAECRCRGGAPAASSDRERPSPRRAPSQGRPPRTESGPLSSVWVRPFKHVALGVP